MYLIQLLLPLHDNRGENFPAAHFNSVRQILTQRFGGVTAFLRSPAVGLWKDGGGDVNRDEVVMFEVVSPELDKSWWASYRSELQQQFRQKELLVWASPVTRL